MRNEIIDRHNNARILKWFPSKGRAFYQVVWVDVAEGVTQGSTYARIGNARKAMRHA